MAAFSSLHFISLSLLILCASSENAVVSPNDICPKTRNPNFCLRVLGSTSGGLSDLGRKAVEAATQSVFFALDEAQALGKFQSDHFLQDKYCSCYKSFGRVNEYIIQYSKLLGLNPAGFLPSVDELIGGKGWCDLRSSSDQLLGSDPSLPFAASNALKAAGACDPLFSAQPSTEPADLKRCPIIFKMFAAFFWSLQISLLQQRSINLK